MSMQDPYRYKTDAIEQILNSDSLVIYGAGTMGKAVRRCLTEKPYEKQIECFIVRNLKDNASIVDGLPVYEIGQAGDYKGSLILIALYEKWISEYKGRLIIIESDNMDFLNRPEDFARITDRIDAELYGLF